MKSTPEIGGGGVLRRMEGLKAIPFVVLLLAVAGIVVGASQVTLAEFRATTTNNDALLAIDNATAGIGTVANQFTTVGVIAVMVIIIGLLASLFVYFNYFR